MRGQDFVERGKKGYRAVIFWVEVVTPLREEKNLRLEPVGGKLGVPKAGDKRKNVMLDEVRADGEKIEICVVWPDRFLGFRAADDFLELLPGGGGKR